MSQFEGQLWSHLVREHGDRMRAAPQATAALAAATAERTSRGRHDALARRRRRPALLTGTALGTAGLATAGVLAFSATSSPLAFAVTDNADGSVTVTLKDISAISALNTRLALDGIAAKAVPLTATCPNNVPMVQMPAGTNPSTYTITIVPSQIPAGYTGVVAASENASGHVQLLQGAVPSPAPSCFNSTGAVFHRVSAANIPPAIKAQIQKIEAPNATLETARR
jgi:hypothetical protein